MPIFQNSRSTQNDALTDSMVAIDYPHHEIHAGDSFNCVFIKDIPNSGTMDMLFVVPDSAKLPHLTISYDCEAEISLAVYRAPTTTGNGTEITVYNRNENSSNVAGVKVYHTPTVTTPGSTIIFSWHAGSGKAVGATERGSAERIMKRNTAYLFRITNITASDNHCAFRFDWYEHTDVRS